MGVAQLGRALPWGGRGRGFKSRHSDQQNKNAEAFASAFFIYKSFVRYFLSLTPERRVLVIEV